MDLCADWRMFFLEITNRCNFDCLFCPSGISQRPRRNMDPSLAMGVIDQLRDLGYRRNLYLHVLGEPLLHPDVFRLIDHAAEAGMRPVLFTNGGALDEGTVAGVLASRAAELVISMQTIGRAAYERLRRTPYDWDTYLGRIQGALAAANDAASGPTWRVSMGIKKRDAGHRDALRPEELYFTEYESLDEIADSIAAVFADVPGADVAAARAALGTHGPEAMPTVALTPRLSLSVKPMGNWRRVWRDEAVTAGTCPFFGKELAVLSDGSVTYCHIDYDGRTSLGNLHERPLAEILGAPEVRAMVGAFVAGAAVARGCEHCGAVR